MNTAVLTRFIDTRDWTRTDKLPVHPRTLTQQTVAREPEALLSIRDLRVAFDTGSHLIPVLHGVDLEIGRGETVGVVGESGCGKSVTWMAVMRLLGERARIDGRILLGADDIATFSERQMAQVRGKRIAMIFQDPSSSLNPVHTVGRQLMEAIRLHRGLRGEAARAEALRLLDRVQLPSAAQRMRAWPHELSGGMNQRVMIAMALAGEPDLLVADEPTTALDVTIQAQILELLRELQHDTGMGLALISHDLGVIAQVCDRVMVMYAGRVVETATADALFSHPMHPYTRGLLAALPELDGPIRKLSAIPGTVPSPMAMPAGCAFAPRCAQREADCDVRRPGLRVGAHNHSVACWRVGK
jgi:peptide/nickel transport system ATP-binding protein